MRSFSYTRDASFSEEFLLHRSGHKEIFYTPGAIYTPEAMFGEEFLLHS